MKFGQELLKKENPRFKGHYIDYKLLKKKLKSPPDRPASETDGTRQERISAAFIESLQLEINRINEYVASIKSEIDAQRSGVEATRKTSKPESDGSEDTSQQMKDLWTATSELREFVELNYTGFYKIAKKHDKVTGIHLLDVILAVVDSQPFMHILESNHNGQQELSQATVHFAEDASECTPSTPIELNVRPARTMRVRSLLEEVARSLEQGASSAPDAVPTAALRMASSPLSVTFSPRLLRESTLGSSGSFPVMRSASNASRESLNMSHVSSLARISESQEATADQSVRDVRDGVPVAVRGGRSDVGATPTNQQSGPPQPIKANIDTITATSIAELLKSSLAHIPDTIPEDDCAEDSTAMSSGDLMRHLTTHLQSAHAEFHPAAHKSVIGLFGRTGGPPVAAEQPPPGDIEVGSTGALAVTAHESIADRQVTTGHVKPSVDWDGFDAEVAHQLQRQFESGLKEAYRFADGAMMVVAPELAENETERYKRLARFSIVMMKCQRRVEQSISKHLSVRYIHDTILGSKLELFRTVMVALVKEIDLTFPEGAAALEHMVQAHHVMFAQYMSSAVRAPTAKRIELVEALRSPVLDKPACRVPGMRLERRRNAGKPTRRRLSDPSVSTSHSHTHVTHDFADRSDADTDDSCRSVAGSVGAVETRLKRSASLPHIFDPSQAVDHYVSMADLQQSQLPSMRARDDSSASLAFEKSDDALGLPLEETPRRGEWHTRRRREPALVLDLHGGALTHSTSDASLTYKMTAHNDSSKALSSLDNMSTRSQQPTSRPQNGSIFSFFDNGRAEIAASWPRWKQQLAVALGLAEADQLGDDYSTVSGLRNTSRHKPVSVLLYERWRPAVLEWMPSYNWRKNFSKDVVAGITIGVVVIPQGLAYATLAGLPPIYGVYTGFPSIIYAIFGTSRHAAIGPMSLPALLMATAVTDLNPAPSSPEEYIGQIMALTFQSGLLLFVMGWLNLGFVVRFISQPVLSGFTSAAALMTIVSVFKDLLGAYVPRSQVFQGYVVGIANALPHTDVATLITGLICIALLYFLPTVKRLKKIPGALLVVILSIVYFAVSMSITGDSGTREGSSAVATRAGIALVGPVPSAFPIPQFPPLGRFFELIPAAVSVSFVGYIESIAVAKMYAVKYGYDVNPSSELKALGLTNMGGSVVQSFLVMGAFGRSAVNESSGARSQMSGIVAAFVVVLLLLVVMPALFYLPKATLAAMIMMAVVKLIKISDVKRLWRVDKRDFLSLSAAFLATLFLGVLPGIVSSMMFSLIVFIAFTTQPQVQELGRVPGTVIYRELGVVGVVRVPDVKIIRFLAPLFFANCSVLKDRLLLELVRRKQLPPRLQWQGLVLCFSSVSNIDSTSVQVLEEVILECHASKLPLLIAAPNLYVEAFLKSSGVTKKLGGDRFLCRRVHEAVRLLLLREVSVADLPEERKPRASDVVVSVAEPPIHPVASRSNWLHQRLVTLSRSIPLQAQELLREVGAAPAVAIELNEGRFGQENESKLDSAGVGINQIPSLVFAQPKQQRSADVDRISLLGQ